jgi:hypothetical protein
MRCNARTTIVSFSFKRSGRKIDASTGVAVKVLMSAPINA